MTLFEAHRWFIRLGMLFGVAPYKLQNGQIQSSVFANFVTIIITCFNVLFVCYTGTLIVLDQGFKRSENFAYAITLDLITFLSVFSGIFVILAIFFNRCQLIRAMRVISSHWVVRKNYPFQENELKSGLRSCCYVLLGFSVALIAGGMVNPQRAFPEVLFPFPLMASFVITMLQFLVAMQVIFLAYGRLHHELLEKPLTVVKLRQLALLDIQLKDYAEVVEFTFNPYNFVYLFLSFFYVLTIELYTAEGGPSAYRAIYSYSSGIPQVLLFIWYIRKNVLLTARVENTLSFLNFVATDVTDPDVRNAVEIFSLQLLSRKLKFVVAGCLPLDFTLVYSMIGSITAYVVTLVQFQTAFSRN